MKYPSIFRAKCCICGESGPCHPDTMWSSNAQHIDPRVCSYNLARKKRLKEIEDAKQKEAASLCEAGSNI